MSDNHHPPHPRFTVRSRRRSPTWKGAFDRLRTRKGVFVGKGDRLGDQGRFDDHQLVTPDTEAWRLLEDAAINAYESTEDFLGSEFCDTLSHWLSSVERVYLYESAQLSSDDETGRTEFPAEYSAVLHLVLFCDSEHPLSKLENRRTLLHEMGHVRDAFFDPLDKLADGIRCCFQWYHDLGVSDWLTRAALAQPDFEQLSWALEGLVLGVDETKPKVWREKRPKLVRLVFDQRQAIAPHVSFGRRLAYNTEQILAKEYDMTSEQGTVLVDSPKIWKWIPGGHTVCKRPFRVYRFSTHPLVRGVLAWLRVQVVGALGSEVCRWDGFGREFDRLRAGTHPDPDPGAVICPDDPGSFKTELLLVAEGDPVSEVGLLLSDLNRDLDIWDAIAWDSIEEDLGVPVSHRLFAEYCLKQIEDEIRMHEREVKTREEIGYVPTGKSPGV